jgi:hypothetical protein
MDHKNDSLISGTEGDPKEPSCVRPGRKWGSPTGNIRARKPSKKLDYDGLAGLLFLDKRGIQLLSVDEANYDDVTFYGTVISFMSRNFIRNDSVGFGSADAITGFKSLRDI